MDLLIHPQISKQIENFIGSPAHALSLSGETGAGKSTIARYIVGRVLEVDMGAIEEHPYVSIIDGHDAKTGIDEVRQLQAFLALKVPGSNLLKRAVIIENLDNLRHEAQNALLKMIEEPPADTIIIVTFSLPTRVLPTLQSRMQSISVLPLDLEQTENALKGRFNKKLISQSYYISGGLAGLFSALLNQENSRHPLVLAIEEAREIIKMPRYQRLSKVDKLLKNKDFSPDLILDGLYRLVDAGYKQSLSTVSKTPQELRPYAERLKLIEQSIRDLQENVQAKLVFSRLFNEL